MLLPYFDLVKIPDYSRYHPKVFPTTHGHLFILLLKKIRGRCVRVVIQEHNDLRTTREKHSDGLQLEICLTRLEK